jgi:undecaprenyl-diphosphatase
VDAFAIVIQGGAILAVLSLYWPHVLRMLKGFLGKDPQGLRLALNLIIAFIPAAIFGKLLDDWIESKLFSAGPVLLALALGGIYMMVVDQWQAGKVTFLPKHNANTETVYDLSWKQSLFVGCMQCIAMWPGTSRSMMTITGGVLAGMKPRQAAEFSFLLGLPTLGAATLYKAYKNVSHAHATNTPNMFEQLGWTPVIVGTLVAAVSAFSPSSGLSASSTSIGLTPFGWYCLAAKCRCRARVARHRHHRPADSRCPRHATGDICAPRAAPCALSAGTASSGQASADSDNHADSNKFISP